MGKTGEAVTNIPQKYSVEKFGKIIPYIYIFIYFFIIFIIIIDIIIYLKHTICRTFLLNIYLHFIWYRYFTWDNISFKAHAFGGFPLEQDVGISELQPLLLF